MTEREAKIAALVEAGMLTSAAADDAPDHKVSNHLKEIGARLFERAAKLENHAAVKSATE